MFFFLLLFFSKICQTKMRACADKKCQSCGLSFQYFRLSDMKFMVLVPARAGINKKHAFSIIKKILTAAAATQAAHLIIIFMFCLMRCCTAQPNNCAYRFSRKKYDRDYLRRRRGKIYNNFYSSIYTLRNVVGWPDVLEKKMQKNIWKKNVFEINFEIKYCNFGHTGCQVLVFSF